MTETASAAPPAGQLTVVVSAPPEQVGAITRAVDLVLATWWSELGAAARPPWNLRRVDSEECVRVFVGELPLRMSARRWEQAVTVALGRPRQPEELMVGWPEWVEQVWRQTPTARERIAAGAVDGMLRAGSSEILSLVGGLDEHGRRNLLAGRAPGSGSPSADWLPSDEPIVVEAEFAALRELTRDMAVAKSLADQLVSTVTRRYGVQVPGFRFGRTTPQDGPAVRFRFGGVATPAHLLPPAGTVAVRVPRFRSLDDPVAGTVIDPLTGERRILVSEGSRAATSEFDVVDRMAWLANLMTSEASLRLALWAPNTVSPWFIGLGDLPKTAEQVLRFLPEVLRRLAADRAFIGNEQPVVEAVLRVLVRAQHRGDPPPDGSSPEAPLVEEMEVEARGALGSGVLADLTHHGRIPIIDVDARLVHDRLGETREAVLGRHPQLNETVGPVVLRVPGDARRGLAEAMRPLADVVHVVGSGEFEVTDALARRWQEIEEKSEWQLSTRTTSSS